MVQFFFFKLNANYSAARYDFMELWALVLNVNSFKKVQYNNELIKRFCEKILL